MFTFNELEWVMSYVAISLYLHPHDETVIQVGRLPGSSLRMPFQGVWACRKGLILWRPKSSVVSFHSRVKLLRLSASLWDKLQIRWRTHLFAICKKGSNTFDCHRCSKAYTACLNLLDEHKNSERCFNGGIQAPGTIASALYIKIKGYHETSEAKPRIEHKTPDSIKVKEPWELVEMKDPWKPVNRGRKESAITALCLIIYFLLGLKYSWEPPSGFHVQRSSNSFEALFNLLLICSALIYASMLLISHGFWRLIPRDLYRSPGPVVCSEAVFRKSSFIYDAVIHLRPLIISLCSRCIRGLNSRIVIVCQAIGLCEHPPEEGKTRIVWRCVSACLPCENA